MISLSYDDTERLGRVRISFSGYSTLADYAVVERSTDQVNWSVVRGGSTVALTSGAGSIDDYEFTSNVVNYYRVTAIDAATPSVGNTGSAGSGNNASVSPGAPAGLARGDTVLLFASIRNSGTGTVDLPAGWTAVAGVGTNWLIASRKIRSASDLSGFSAPTVTFSGGAANADTLAVLLALHNVDPPVSSAVTSLNSSAQNVSTPGFSFAAGDIKIRTGWKQDDSTGMPAPAGYTTVMSVSSSAGDDASMAATAAYTASAGTEGTATITWDGGAASISRGASFSLPMATYVDLETGSITPAVTRFRIKSPTRPSLNMIVEPIEDEITISRAVRSGTFDVLGRTLPVAVVDKAGSRRTTLLLDVKGDAEKEDTDRRLASGGVYQLHTPYPSGAVPNMFFLLESVSFQMDTKYLADSYTFTLDMIEVARPPSTVYGYTSTWQTIVDDFLTWSSLLAAEATWSDVVDRVSDSDVIVP